MCLCARPRVCVLFMRRNFMLYALSKFAVIWLIRMMIKLQYFTDSHLKVTIFLFLVLVINETENKNSTTSPTPIMVSERIYDIYHICFKLETLFCVNQFIILSSSKGCVWPRIVIPKDVTAARKASVYFYASHANNTQILYRSAKTCSPC